MINVKKMVGGEEARRWHEARGTELVKPKAVGKVKDKHKLPGEAKDKLATKWEKTVILHPTHYSYREYKGKGKKAKKTVREDPEPPCGDFSLQQVVSGMQ